MASLRLLDQFKNVRCSSTPSKRLRLKLGFKTSTSVGISRCKVRKLTDEFTRIKSASILGKGGFSTVKLVYRKEGNKREYYAVKVLDKPDNEPDETYVARALAEFDIGRNLCHTSIIKTLDLCRKGDKLCFVMEYCKHGDLCGLMDRRYLTYGDAKCLFKQLLRGIAYMHSRGIAHHDIKPENLLLADDGTLKIIDFGLSVVFADLLPANDRGERKLSKCRLCGPRLCGTTSFLPPEVLRLKGNYDPRTVDVWSCAITFYALFTRYMPWGEADTTRDDAFAEFQARWEEYLEKCPDTPIVETCIPRCFGFFNRLPTSNGLRVLLARMLHPFSEKRITIFEALKDPWVERIECCSPEMNYLSSIRAAGDIIIPNVHDHLSKIRHSFSY